MRNTTTKICIISMMTSMVLISTFIRIPFPMGGAHTMIHLGNIFCILSGLLLGPINGGISAGLGSFVFDILAPGYIMSAPFTLVFKFIMGAVCGLISKYGKGSYKDVLAALIGATLYIFLHAFKNFFRNMYLFNVPLQANFIIIGKGMIIPIINASLAVTFAVPLYKILKNIMNKSKIFNAI